MADKRRPSVSIVNNTNYKVIIDGRTIQDDYDGSYEIRNMNFGRHTVSVVEDRNSFFFGKRGQVVSKTDFKVDGDDRKIMIYVGRSGNINIRKDESGYGRDDNDYGWRNGKGYDKRKGNGRSYDWNDSRDYDSNNQGKGRRYDKENGRDDDNEYGYDKENERGYDKGNVYDKENRRRYDKGNEKENGKGNKKHNKGY
jgi:hypothetical protein